ncbi:MAG: PQQ-dependent sugar dehydrogenase [Dehalococcoidia bacterium]
MALRGIRDCLGLRLGALVLALPVVIIPGLACDGSGRPDPTPGPAATPTATPVPAEGSFTATRVATGFTRPTFVTNASDNSNRLFVLEKPGRIRLIKSGLLVAQPFLDITAIVGSASNEQGLLGLAFHPDFEKNGRFFVAYTAKDASNTVAEYRVTNPSDDVADANSGKVLLAVADQYPNHNGGMLAFGRDGYLYISMGDGGSAGDPNGNGQNLNSLLGKLLRIDVNSGSPYGIPADNPFVSKTGARPEVWAYGLRNPWRFTFDRQTGDLWIGDVGQDKYEEVDFQPAESKGGENYGWSTMEGTHCYKPQSDCKQDGLTLPVYDYDHGQGCSVTGGYVYRGKAITPLVGRYLFVDYCASALQATTRSSDGTFTTAEIGKVPTGITAFGEDEAGEVYFTVDNEGAVYKLVKK